MTKPTLILYTRPECHLCEQALELIAGEGLRAEARDITGDLDLLARYRDRIPVLARADTGAEIGWPFDAGDARRLAGDE